MISDNSRLTDIPAHLIVSDRVPTAQFSVDSRDGTTRRAQFLTQCRHLATGSDDAVSPTVA